VALALAVVSVMEVTWPASLQVGEHLYPDGAGEGTAGAGAILRHRATVPGVSQ
jgi:hypothetical protein